jgi:hypothetical protein
METAAPLATRKRASTFQEAGVATITETGTAGGNIADEAKPKTDVFENREGDDDEDQHDSEAQGHGLGKSGVNSFEELPIEIRSLAERFLESLSAKVHPTPLNADNLSELFQDFYERAASHISTHIATLASRIGRGPSAQQSAAKGLFKGRSRSGSGATRGSSDDLVGSGGGEMLTATEVADRKRARRLLEMQRYALEEAVERGVCERVYDKIWKHRSTDDEARDEKLRSRTAALALVGIGLKELRIDPDSSATGAGRTAEEKEDEIYQSLSVAREALQNMNDERHPLGKLQHLTAAHKAIVETLSKVFPSTSSADEILPTLIYTLITSPPDEMNVVGNLGFIQRFRSSSKVDGEAAYCMVNLEAAISFLETVDLSSLRADELPEGPPKSTSRPSTPSSELPPLMQRPATARTLTPGLTTLTATATEQSNSDKSAAEVLPAATTSDTLSNPRRISTLMQAQAERLEAGRENILYAADKIYDSINGTLDNSFQFIFGRFKEQAATGDHQLPKTLEEARKLVNSPSIGGIADDENPAFGILGKRESSNERPSATHRDSSSKLVDLVGGRRATREHSVDSARSGGSGKRVAFASTINATGPGPESGGTLTPRERAVASLASDSTPAQEQSLLGSSPANLFASINPLNRFGMPTFPRFGRPGPTSAPQTTASPTAMTPTGEPSAATSSLHGNIRKPSEGRSTPIERSATPANKGDITSNNESNKTDADPEESNARTALATLRQIKPPRKRFLEVPSSADLTLGEVEDLLNEYRRLAKAIGEALASSS